MKKMNGKFAVAAIAVGSLVTGMRAHAQSTITAQSGDLILAFEIPDQNGGATGGQENLEVDLGSYASLYSAAGGLNGTVNLGSFLSLADLTTTYGSGWNTTNGGDAVDWTVFGTNTSTYELWTTDTHKPQNDSAGDLQSTSGEMGPIYSDMNGKTSTANSNYAYVTNSQSDSQSFTQDNGVGVNNWGDNYGDIPSSVLQATTNTGEFLLYDVQPGAPGNAKAVGEFQLASNGNLTFTAVPEPSTWASIILGAFSLLAFGRRRRILA
jgi:hypothetical protein